LQEEIQSVIKNHGKRVNDAEMLRNHILKVCSIRPFKKTELARRPLLSFPSEPRAFTDIWKFYNPNKAIQTQACNKGKSHNAFPIIGSISLFAANNWYQSAYRKQ
jgi:hypothetical protein